MMLRPPSVDPGCTTLPQPHRTFVAYFRWMHVEPGIFVKTIWEKFAKNVRFGGKT